MRPWRRCFLPPDRASAQHVYTLYPTGAVLEEEAAEEVLPAAGLVTASADYYPTVAINALMRTLRDPVMAPHHAEVVRALFYIFTVRWGYVQGSTFDLNAKFQLQHAEVVRVLSDSFMVRQFCARGWDVRCAVSCLHQRRLQCL